MSAAPDVDPCAGEEVGPFRITRRLGAGRAGQVYVARHHRHDRDVALELISSPLATDREFRVRFARTARTMAGLYSEHLVPVHTFGEDRGRLYLATQLIPDGDLATALRTRGAPPLGLALDVVGQVAAGLADAHRAGLVHRALTPADVLLSEGPEGVTAYLTGLGTPTSAEQRPFEAAWDVHTMGWLLWTTATGLAPYAGLPQLAGDSPQVQHVNHVLRTAMAADPARRYPSADALRDDLRRAASLAGPSWLPASPPVRRRRRGLLALAAGVGAALVVGAGGAVAAGVAMRDHQSSTSVAGPASGWSEDDERRAEANIADAFGAQLLVGSGQATCIAERWVASVGLDLLVEERFLDDDMTFWDRDLGSADPRVRDALADATAACLDG